ncbi:metallophosphoesterase [Cypionkella sp.]|uniref:metallophosphoesterase n=1 Tax=Cypionkella sp. TaxID=2811411 RepID=UPI002AC9826B|nr:metallophosphoesterase [Cypionkella sp.]
MGGYSVAEAALRLHVQNWALQPAGWRRGQRLRIAMVADLHASSFGMDERRVARVVGLANAQGADLIALMGDYRASHRFQTRKVSIDVVAPILAGLRAPLGVYAVTGNHDWWDDREAMARRAGPCHTQVVLEAAGIPVLANRAIKLGAAGAAFWLGGTESQACFQRENRRDIIGMSDVPGVVAQMSGDDPAILLAHEPDQFVTVPDRVALTLSGHTHGGQIRFGPWAPVVPSRFGQRFDYGHFREGARDLVVSGGLGCSGLPIRFGVPPEITVVDLS